MVVSTLIRKFFIHWSFSGKFGNEFSIKFKKDDIEFFSSNSLGVKGLIVPNCRLCKILAFEAYELLLEG